MKNLIVLSFVLIFSFNANAQNENSLIWEISGKGLEQKSYLFGTVHLIPENKYFFTDEMQKSFNSCKALALEIDMNISVVQQLAIAKKIMIPNNKTIKDFMSKKDYERLGTYMIDSLKVNTSTFNQIKMMKPLFAYSLILTKLIDNPVTYELRLTEKAKKRNMEILGLETMEYQLSVIEKVPVKEQVKGVYTDGIGKSPLKEYNEMIDAYVSQNLKKLKEMTKEDSTIQEFEKDFLITRNKNWIPKIEKFAKNKSTFFAVGAAHLLGKNGVITLLRNDGYTVKPVEQLGLFEKMFWKAKNFNN